MCFPISVYHSCLHPNTNSQPSHLPTHLLSPVCIPNIPTTLSPLSRLSSGVYQPFSSTCNPSSRLLYRKLPHHTLSPVSFHALFSQHTHTPPNSKRSNYFSFKHIFPIASLPTPYIISPASPTQSCSFPIQTILPD